MPKSFEGLGHQKHSDELLVISPACAGVESLITDEVPTPLNKTEASLSFSGVIVAFGVADV
ncbi:17456_t:CDS:2, partial [Cetraspora pellucida]